MGKRSEGDFTVEELRQAAINVCASFLNSDDHNDTQMREAKIALGIWATVSREAQTAGAARAVEVVLARELYTNPERLAEYVRAAFPAGSPLVKALTDGDSQHSGAERGGAEPGTAQQSQAKHRKA